MRRPLTIDELFTEVAREFKSDLDTIKFWLASKNRTKPIVTARRLVSMCYADFTMHSSPDIAKAMGRRNHSTIITARNDGRWQMSKDREFAGMYDRICDRLSLLQLKGRAA